MCQGEVLYFYTVAKEFCIKAGYADEIDFVRKRCFEDATAKDFIFQYAYVVINSGLKNQVAEKICERFFDACDFNVIGHPGKRGAIIKVWADGSKHFEELCESRDKLSYLESLPWIGPITKFHLARNLGLDVAKPDRHMVRLAKRFGFEDVHVMYAFIAERVHERVGTVDVILWRYCNLNPGGV